MLSEIQLNRYADVLIWALKVARKNPFKKQDTILLQYDRQALGLAEILYNRILDMGMNPDSKDGPDGSHGTRLLRDCE